MAAELAQRAPPDLLAGALVPVPAHPGRARRHGFNQALELARSLARITGCPSFDVLAREGVRTQVGLERGARLRNARRSIRMRGGTARMPTGRSVTLVDDVYTTGATLDACAAALREAGAEQVFAVTFARAVRV
jgi:ComF family protein